jgi:hypothetical protein
VSTGSSASASSTLLASTGCSRCTAVLVQVLVLVVVLLAEQCQDGATSSSLVL